jgi:hypothetical protein
VLSRMMCRSRPREPRNGGAVTGLPPAESFSATSWILTSVNVRVAADVALAHGSVPLRVASRVDLVFPLF